MILFLYLIKISFKEPPISVKILKKLVGSTLSATITATPANQTFNVQRFTSAGPSNVAVIVHEFFM